MYLILQRRTLPHASAIMFVMVFLRNSWLPTELVKQPPSTNDANPNHVCVRPRGEREGESGKTGNERWPQTVVVENLDRAGGGGEKSTYLN